MAKKTAVVTGSNSGIGLGSAHALAAAGYNVVINSFTDRPADHDLAKEIAAQHATGVAYIKADMSKGDECRALIDQAAATFGSVDVLVNNAGIMKLGKIADSDDAAFDQQVAVNLKGSFNTMREAARRLRNGGRIVNFSTSVVGTRLETYGIYVATKAAIESLTAILSKELRGRGITVNAVAPGPTATDLFLNGKSDELIDRFAKMVPLERLGTPDDIASAVSFLAGPGGAWINGQTLRANGGLV